MRQATRKQKTIPKHRRKVSKEHEEGDMKSASKNITTNMYRTMSTSVCFLC